MKAPEKEKQIILSKFDNFPSYAAPYEMPLNYLFWEAENIKFSIASCQQADFSMVRLRNWINVCRRVCQN